METERNPIMRINVDAKLLLIQKDIFKSKRIATVEIARVKKTSDIKYTMIQKMTQKE
jgi:hypothetical protein